MITLLLFAILITLALIFTALCVFGEVVNDELLPLVKKYVKHKTKVTTIGGERKEKE